MNREVYVGLVGSSALIGVEKKMADSPFLLHDLSLNDQISIKFIW